MSRAALVMRFIETHCLTSDCAHVGKPIRLTSENSTSKDLYFATWVETWVEKMDKKKP
jgi:hypothetical protein